MIDYNKKYLSMIKEIIFSIIDKNEYKVFLFGSRASKNFSRYSDVDIGVSGKNQSEVLIIKSLIRLRNLIFHIKLIL